MADTTSRYSFPFQEAADAPDGPALGQDLAEAVELSLGVLEDRVDDQYAWIAQVRFTSNGSFTKATYPTARKVRVRVQAAGGGGGGAPAAAAGQTSAASGGGAGGYSESWLDTSALASSVTVTVGAGGAVASGAAGSTGGASSFGAHVTANAGTGGLSVGSGATIFTCNCAGGGAVGTGDIAIGGQPSQLAMRMGTIAGQTFGSAGAPSQLGAGGFGGRNFAGGAANGYGAGGGGASCDPSGAAESGGLGAPGIVIVDLYA